jgi:hypothetical protein
MVGSPKDFTPPAKPKNVKIKVVDNKEVNITWEKTGNTNDLKGYVIAKGGSVAGPLILSKKRFYLIKVSVLLIHHLSLILGDIMW